MGWETAMTVGGVEILGGLGVVVDEVLEVTNETAVVVGNGASVRGGEEGNVFMGNVSAAVGATDSVF